jgi:hypothetical protein
MRWVVLGCVLGGCSFSIPASSTGSPDAVDGKRADTPVTACFGSFVQVCPGSVSDVPIMLAGPIDTDSSPLCDQTITTSCVVMGSSITLPLGVIVTGTGTRPLVLLATAGAIALDGLLSVASVRPSTMGAGAAIGPCSPGTAPTENGGGQGGGFGAEGGAGGIGTLGTPGVAGAVEPLAALRGGCPGAAGGGVAPGAGGLGGGVVDLIASSINVTGTIDASGTGGDAATVTPNGAGGGGGGSGGAIVFDTPDLSIAFTAVVFANGGGGGEGSSQTNNGVAGSDPISTAAAFGGAFGTNSGDGGAGSSGGVGAAGGMELCAATTCGGGGGGGGAGMIKTTDPTPPATSSLTMSPNFAP